VNSSFSVAPFKVVATNPPNSITNVDLDAPIYLGFTGLIDTGSVRQSFVMAPPAAGLFELSAGATSFGFIPLTGLNPSTSYSVTMTGELHAYNGTSLSTPYTFSFATAPFRVRSTYPSDGDLNVYRGQSISVNCNGRIDTGSVRSAFAVNPPVAGNFSLYDGGSGFAFIPGSVLAPNTNYTVTISTLLRTKTGYNFAQPYSWTFKTGP